MLLSWEMIHRSGSHNSGDLTLTGSPLDNDLDVDMDMLDAGISLTTAPIPELEIVDIVGDEVGLPYSRFYLCHNSLPTRRKAVDDLGEGRQFIHEGVVLIKHGAPGWAAVLKTCVYSIFHLEAVVRIDHYDNKVTAELKLSSRRDGHVWIH